MTSAPASIEQDETSAETTTVISLHPMADRAESLRIIEAMLFAAAEPLSVAAFGEFLPSGVDVSALLADLAANYENRGVNIVQVAGKYALRTAPDMGSLLRREKIEQKRLTKAALETLSIVAYQDRKSVV